MTTKKTALFLKYGSGISLHTASIKFFTTEAESEIKMFEEIHIEQARKIQEEKIGLAEKIVKDTLADKRDTGLPTIIYNLAKLPEKKINFYSNQIADKITNKFKEAMDLYIRRNEQKNLAIIGLIIIIIFLTLTLFFV